MEIQGTKNSQNNLEKKSWKTRTYNLVQSYSNQNSVETGIRIGI